MSAPTPRVPRISRESRLLLTTIAVSVLVLLLLARLRFPQPPAVVNTTPEPLQRLAARASYDELAGAVARTQQAVAANLIVLRVSPLADSGPIGLSDVLARSEAVATDHYVPALRLAADAAIAALDEHARIEGIVGEQSLSGTAAVLAVDPVRSVARVRVPPVPARALNVRPLTELATPTYVVAIEGTNAGVTIRPVFLGRGERFGTARWNRPLLPLGGLVVSPGAFIFSMDGYFLGLVVDDHGALAIAPARDVLEAADRLAAGSARVPADPGFTVQPLTPALAAATDVESGVIVADVAANGPSTDVLEPGDVITGLDGESIASPDRLLLDIAGRQAGETIALTRVRAGASETVQLTLSPPASDSRVEEPGSTLTLIAERGAGTRILAVDPASPLGRAGCVANDVITAIDRIRTPAPRDVRRILAEAPEGSFVVATVRRDDRQRVIAIEIPSADAPVR